ncbi:hypothetical protein THAOC_31542 [Thalassiosira oceanica]|uniref:Protein kinase domain-containing protein n=1 Tax=Thalassiosira oceanica TaxID=159749 RepID=K0RL10_THAOC|nr:hypothetical protein THAOC_31542 [Thalassiosira oceanica]|eukprot:EJK49566.1 hypothetical protein THAOC_31542 [Thalassiosira oceanica]
MRRTKGKLSTDQIDALNISRRDGGEELSEREVASAWYRYGVDITDVYDVIDILGQGHMGEVFTVRRKTTGHHTDITRHKQKESTEDLQRMKRRQDELDKKKELKSKKPFSPVISPVKGAFKKPLFKGTKKVIGKIEKKIGKEREASIDADADSNLAKFIGAADDPEIIPAPPKSPRGPLKPAIKKDAEAKYSDSPLPKAKPKVSGDDLVGDTATLTLLDTTPSDASVSSSGATDIAKKTKITMAVHFQRTFAVKTILTSRINKNQIQELVNEIMIMRKLDHPYVLKLYEVYHVKRKLWLVTELLSGGDLSARKLNEHGTKRVIEQVLRALAYLHRMGVLHRDIKLENILYENHSKNATVRLIDFGLSRTFDRTMVAADYTRTPYTMSPEMAREKKARMTDKTDVWAVGIIAFIMLSGEFPFIKSQTDLKNDHTMERLKHVSRVCLRVCSRNKLLSGLFRLDSSMVSRGVDEELRKKQKTSYRAVYNPIPMYDGQPNRHSRICRVPGVPKLIRYALS